jgi:hypothetical protein
VFRARSRERACVMQVSSCARMPRGGWFLLFAEPDIHVSQLSRGGASVPGALARARVRDAGFVVRTYASRRVVPALRRTGHPFAVSGSREPSQKIELVFSASPKTIRREPQERKLRRSVGNRQDLAVCASMILFIEQFLSCPSPALLCRDKLALLPVYG